MGSIEPMVASPTLITDWLMVIITAVYVIATIAICVANFKSAKATRDQISESNRQFTESKHLQIMPFIQASFPRVKRHYYDIELPCSDENPETEIENTVISIENVGKGTANNITYTWEYGKIHVDGEFGLVGIREGTLYHIGIHFRGNLIKENSRGLLILHYSDLLGRWYKQTVLLQFINDRDNEDNMKIWAETPIVDQSKEKPHG